ncbi:hypothetical protein Aduo_001030 [Ancylostoma duodenale]
MICRTFNSVDEFSNLFQDEPARNGPLPHGLERIGAELDANGAPLTDTSSVVASMRGDSVAAPEPVAPVATHASQFSFGVRAGVMPTASAFQSNPYSGTSHMLNGQDFPLLAIIVH